MSEMRIDRAMERIALLEVALTRSVIALDDWLHVHAPDMSDEMLVKASMKRVSEHGTLAYIAEVQRQNRAALNATAKPAKGE